MDVLPGGAGPIYFIVLNEAGFLVIPILRDGGFLSTLGMSEQRGQGSLAALSFLRPLPGAGCVWVAPRPSV